MKLELRKRLFERQSLEELRRKAKKAIRLKSRIWTYEEIAFAERQGKIWADFFAKREDT